MVSLKLNSLFSTVIAVGTGLVVLVAYFLPLPTLVTLRTYLLQSALLLAGVALIVGVVNLLGVHWHKLRSRQKGGFYSLALIISLLGTVLVVGWFGPTGYWSLWLYHYLQMPIEASLMAILAVTLAYAGARLLRRRVNLLSIVFLVTVVLILLGSGPLPPAFEDIFAVVSQYLRPWIAAVPATAGGRGILLGVALGTIATGLRILMGIDRPYSG